MPRITITCLACGKPHIYTKKTSGPTRRYHPSCAHRIIMDRNAAYHKKWYEAHKKERGVYNREWYKQLKILEHGVEQKRLAI
jgi:hypothetical protein